MTTAALRALLEHSIDYAGLFPPANLVLEQALRNHAEYVRDADVWMLGTFILPVAKFDAAAGSLTQFDSQNRFHISALGLKTNDAKAFLDALSEARTSIESFRRQHGNSVSIKQIEMPLPSDPNGELLAKIKLIVADLNLNAFWESPWDSAEQTIRSLAAKNPNASGFKLRTGGVTADAFPSSSQIASALIAAFNHRVPIKFTAGLHHPVRQFHASVGTKMHGFLNVFGAGVLAAEHGWEAEQTAQMLDDENADSFSFEGDSFAWREWKITADRIREHRKLVTSFGSCSFDEPREDLRALNLL